MGQDLRAIVPHRLKPDRILKLPELLNSWNKRLLKLLPAVNLDGNNLEGEAWRFNWGWFGGPPNDASDIFTFWDNSNVILLEGPGSIFLSFGKKCAIIGSNIRWREFLSNQDIFDGWKEIVRYFASFLRAYSALYAPDSGSGRNAIAEDCVFNGDSFEAIKDFLLGQCGPPLTSIDNIKELNGGIYFYDDFGMKEYDEGAVLTRYIWNNYREFITEWEHKVNLAIIMDWKAEVYEDPASGWKYDKQLGEDFKNDTKAHEEIKHPDAFRNEVRDHVLKEYKQKVFINRCSKCNKIVRTPKARQCFWCGYDWH